MYYYNTPAQKLCGIKTNDSSLPPYIFIGKGTASWRMFGGSLDDNNNFTITTYKYTNNLSQTVQTANDVVSLYNNNSQAASDFDNKQVKDITSNSDACSSILSSSLQQVAPSGTAPSGTAPSAPAPNTSTSTLLPSNYQVYQDGVDCWGGDISGQSIQDSNLGECARKCDALPNCTGFSFGTNNSCKPKSFSPFPPNSAIAKCDASSIDTFYKKN